jgi:dihydrofolate reductase
MIVSAIVAKDKNNLIGIGLEMPWHQPKDFKYFKETTVGHPIIFGHSSFKSIGCRPLPKRPHIIVSRDPELNYEGVDCVTTVEDAITLAKTFGSDEVFICGGGQIYYYALKNRLIDRLYITEIHTKIHFDEWDGGQCVYFPQISHDDWDMVTIKTADADEKNKYDMTFLQFERN